MPAVASLLGPEGSRSRARLARALLRAAALRGRSSSAAGPHRLPIRAPVELAAGVVAPLHQPGDEGPVHGHVDPQADPPAVPGVGRPVEARVAQQRLLIGSGELERERGPALVDLVHREDVLPRAEVRMAPGLFLARVRQGQAQPPEARQDRSLRGHDDERSRQRALAFEETGLAASSSRSSLRATLPRSFFGSEARHSNQRGYLCGASLPLIQDLSSAASVSLPARPSRRTTNAKGLVSPSSSSCPTTHTSATAGCSSSAFSISSGEVKMPETLRRSSARPS